VGRRWRPDVLLRPQVVAAALALLLAALFVAVPSGPSRPPPPSVDLEGGSAPPIVSGEVRLVLIDGAGLQRPRFVTARYPDSDQGRLEAVLSALRSELIIDRVWPPEGAPPTLFLGEIGVRRFAVLDFGEGFGALDIAAERQLIASLLATLRVEGIEEVRVLRDGGPDPAPFGHLALPAPL
jgi:hypothetical protein